MSCGADTKPFFHSSQRTFLRLLKLNVDLLRGALSVPIASVDIPSRPFVVSTVLVPFKSVICELNCLLHTNSFWIPLCSMDLIVTLLFAECFFKWSEEDF